MQYYARGEVSNNDTLGMYGRSSMLLKYFHLSLARAAECLDSLTKVNISDTLLIERNNTLVADTLNNNQSKSIISALSVCVYDLKEGRKEGGEEERLIRASQ